MPLRKGALLLSLFLFFRVERVEGKFLRFDITGYKRSLHTYKEVCQKMGQKELLLVSAIDSMRIDCMGTSVNVKEFCQRRERRPSLRGLLLRGYVNKKMEEVACEYGSSAILSLSCEGKMKHFCTDAQKGCEKLNKIYAYEHDLLRASLVREKNIPLINCLYRKKEAEDLLEEVIKIRPLYDEKEIIDQDLFLR